MKKYILFISILCFTISSAMAEKNPDIAVYQDSIKKKKRTMPGFSEKDMEEWKAMAEEMAKQGEMLAQQFEQFEQFEGLSIPDNMNGLQFNWKDAKERKPTRTEKKVFNSISEIEIDHKYGNIIVKESSSKQIDLEIQYFDNGSNKASCDISSSKGILFITTTSSSQNNEKINYIISIPRKTALNIGLKYGNLKMDNHSGTFKANISYGNLDAQSFSTDSPSIDIKYGNINIGSVKTLSLAAAYSKVFIDNLDKLQVSSKYTDYVIKNAGLIDTGDLSSYGNFKIGTLGTMKANIEYSDVSIDNLTADFTAKTAYGNINIKTPNPKSCNITVDGAYSDVTVIVPENTPTAFNVNLKYGNLIISKKHSNVSYTHDNTNNQNVEKIGSLGDSKNPKIKINVLNKYADVKIR